MDLIQLNKKDPFDKNAEDREKLLIISKCNGSLSMMNAASAIASSLMAKYIKVEPEAFSPFYLDIWTNRDLLKGYLLTFKPTGMDNNSFFLTISIMSEEHQEAFQQILETYGWQVTFGKLTQFLQAGLHRQDIITAYKWLSENLHNIKG